MLLVTLDVKSITSLVRKVTLYYLVGNFLLLLSAVEIGSLPKDAGSTDTKHPLDMEYGRFMLSALLKVINDKVPCKLNRRPLE